MTKSLLRRINAIEDATPSALPPELRAWLGDPVAESERQKLAARGALAFTSAEFTRPLPADLRAWLDERPAATSKEN